MRNAFYYFKEKNIQKIILGLLVLINLSVVVAGFILLYFWPGKEHLSVYDTLWESVKIFFDPASVLSLKLSAVARVFTGMLVLIGMITFTGGAVGYITNLITESISNSRQGKGEVNIMMGTLFLNWNNCAMDIIFDHVSDRKRKMKDDYFIILSNEDKSSLENEIKKRISDFKANNVGCNKEDPRIIVRTGNPESAYDLDNANWEYAKAIYIFQPRNVDNPDYQVMKTYLGLANCIKKKRELEKLCGVADIEEKNNLPVIVETCLRDTADAITCYLLGEASEDVYCTKTISTDYDLGKIYGQIALMPELIGAVKDLLNLTGSRLFDINITDNNDSFEKEMKTLKYAIPLYEHEDEYGKARVYLSSEGAIVLGEDGEFEREECSREIELPKYKYNPDFDTETHRIVIVGFNHKVPFMLDSFMAYNKSHPKNPINVVFCVTQEQVFEVKKIVKNDCYKGLFKQDYGIEISDYYAIGDIRDYIDDDLHSLVILSRDDVEEAKIDQNVFEMWLSLSGQAKFDEEFLKTIEGKVVLEVSDASNVHLLEDIHRRKVVVSNDFASLFMSQMAEGETIYDIMMDMLSNSYDEISEILNYDECDLISIKASKLYGIDEDRKYGSKREFIVSVFQGTNEKLIPIGVVKEDGDEEITYLFTNGKDTYIKDMELTNQPSLSDSILIEDNERTVIEEKNLEINADDYVILIKKN